MFFNRNRYFKNFRVEELKLMKIAAQFSSNFRPDLKATELLYQLTRAIDGRVNYNVPSIILGVIIFIVIIAIYSVSSNSSSKRSSTALPSPEELFNTPTAIKSSLIGKTWMDNTKKRNAENRLPLHFFTFFNSKEGEHAILLPLKGDQQYASVNMPFRWGISKLGSGSSNLTIAYTSPPETHGIEDDHLTEAQQKLLEDVKTLVVAPSVQYPIKFEFPNKITFVGFLPDNPLRSTFVPLRGDKTWDVIYGIEKGEHPFVDRLLAASIAADYLLEHTSMQNKNKRFKLYVHPNDLSIHLRRGLNSIAIGQFVKTKNGLTFNPYKWAKDTTDLPSFFIGLHEIHYFDERHTIKTGNLKVYYPSFSADTARVVLR
jgi:hypothetical protein